MTHATFAFVDCLELCGWDNVESLAPRPLYCVSPDDEDSMRAAIGDADTVVNLIGKYYETKHICFTRKEDGSISRINSSFKNVSLSC